MSQPARRLLIVIRVIFKSMHYLLFKGWDQKHWLTEDEIRAAGKDLSQ
jgi:hypothetical protein